VQRLIVEIVMRAPVTLPQGGDLRSHLPSRTWKSKTCLRKQPGGVDIGWRGRHRDAIFQGLHIAFDCAAYQQLEMGFDQQMQPSAPPLPAASANVPPGYPPIVAAGEGSLSFAGTCMQSLINWCWQQLGTAICKETITSPKQSVVVPCLHVAVFVR